MIEKNDVCDTIEGNEFFQSLLFQQEQNDNNKTNNTIINSSSLSSSSSSNTLSFTEQIKKLSEGLELISTELQSQVREKHGALLSQASHAGKISVSLEAVCGHMKKLQSGADRLKQQVQVPFEIVDKKTNCLERVHDALNILRNCGRFLQLYGNLKKTTQPLEQARILNDLDVFTENVQLGRIDLIRDELIDVIQIRKNINQMANKELLIGLETENQQQIANNLSIYLNLNTLNKCIMNMVKCFLNDIQQTVKQTLSDSTSASSKISNTKLLTKDNQKILRVPGKTPTLATSQHSRGKFWTTINELFDKKIFNYCKQIIFLQSAILSIQNTSIDFNTTDQIDVEQIFWQKLQKILKISIDECPAHVKQYLQQDLPKLLAATRGMQAKFGTKFVFSDSLYTNLETGYLEQCAANLKATLAGFDCPTQETVDGLVRAASLQLSAAMVDDRLCLLVANVFSSCNCELFNKIESHVKLGTDSQQVIDIPNASQIQNTILVNTLYYHNDLVNRFIQNLGTHFMSSLAAKNILKNLCKGEMLTLAIMQQLIESMNKAIHSILLSMHREPGLNNDQPLSATPSLYMKELQEFLYRTWNLHITPFNDKQSIEKSGRAMAERCIELFILNVAILRPISNAGRQKLKLDSMQLENVLKPIVNDISTLGKPYRQLHALSALLSLSPLELSQQSIDSFDTSSSFITFVTIFLLFGHAGVELNSPHTAAGWSHDKLLNWLDGHTSNRERLELINGALQKYRTIVRQKNITQYDPIYPYLTKQLEIAMKNI